MTPPKQGLRGTASLNTTVNYNSLTLKSLSFSFLSCSAHCALVLVFPHNIIYFHTHKQILTISNFAQPLKIAGNKRGQGLRGTASLTTTETYMHSLSFLPPILTKNSASLSLLYSLALNDICHF